MPWLGCATPLRSGRDRDTVDLFLHGGMHVAKHDALGRLAFGERLMELHLQFGYGMMDHSRALVADGIAGTVILSPRDLNPTQLQKLASEVVSHPNGRVLLDPQLYLPHADHARLVSHDYWPDQYITGTFWSGPELRALLKRVIELNASLDAGEILLPGLFAEHIDDDWIDRIKLTIDEAKGLAAGKPLLASIALGADAVRSDSELDDVLVGAEQWDVDGVYLVCEHPRGDYLSTDASWMANLLDLIAGLRLKGKRVIVGYCNHQMLALAAAGATAIASGTWMNVRSFPPDKFRAQYDEEIKQRAIWYYSPQAFSEYKVTFLDIALKQGILSDLAPSPDLGSKYADVLFAGKQPTSLRWSEQAAFRHYLSCLGTQVARARKATFDETADAHDRALDAAEALLARLHASGVKGQQRDFRECVDANRAALSVLRSNRGPQLRRSWSAL
jgi:hypothetical protein